MHGHAGGEKEDGRPVALRAQPPADLETVQLGHQDVQDDGVGPPGDDLRDRLDAVLRALDLVALELQGLPERLADGRIVVDYEQPHRFQLRPRT